MVSEDETEGSAKVGAYLSDRLLSRLAETGVLQDSLEGSRRQTTGDLDLVRHPQKGVVCSWRLEDISIFYNPMWKH
jgi:hypothetical protein